MRVSNINNQNFRALLGKKEITYIQKNGETVGIHTVQHIYPFVDEFKTSKAQKDALAQIKKSEFFVKQNSPTYSTPRSYEVVMEEALPFTKGEYLQAKKNPAKNPFTQFVNDYIIGNQIESVTTTSVGEQHALLVEKGEIKFQ